MKAKSSLCSIFMIMNIIIFIIVDNLTVVSLFRLYASKVMIGCVENELRAMRSGLNDVIPSELLTSLTPEVSHQLCDQQSFNTVLFAA